MMHPVLPALLSTLFITAVLFLLLAPTLGLADEISSSIDAACVASLSSLAGDASASGMSVGAGGGTMYACYNILAFTPPTFIADLRLFESPSPSSSARYSNANISTDTGSPTIEIVWPPGIEGDSVAGGAALTRRAPSPVPNWKELWKRQNSGTGAAPSMQLTNKWVFTGTITDESLLSQSESVLKSMMLPAVNLVSGDGGKVDLSSSSSGSMASYVFGVMADTTSGSAITPAATADPPEVVVPSSTSEAAQTPAERTLTPTTSEDTAAVTTGLLTDSSVSEIGANGPTTALVPTPAPSNSAVDTSTSATSALAVDTSSSTPAAESTSSAVVQASSSSATPPPTSTSAAATSPTTAPAFTPTIAAAIASSSSSSPSSSAPPLALADTAQPQSAPAAAPALQATIATPFVLPGTSLGITPIGTYVFSAWTGIFGIVVGAGFWRKQMFRGQYRRRVNVNVKQGGGGVVGNGLRSEFSM
ncbi:hypothetical protein SAICODRAFT_148513 [Saitoella complicata NRRL Y-17804]|nr:uncharacterized protein SAICODRAFT_148513 [Saitoella complicata NRRL Y-17804]ODQ55573.1 hypothetical protein SAICODRAFT_148513 [Saitoella complicata NRRL Y-17804]